MDQPRTSGAEFPRVTDVVLDIVATITQADDSSNLEKLYNKGGMEKTGPTENATGSNQNNVTANQKPPRKHSGNPLGHEEAHYQLQQSAENVRCRDAVLANFISLYVDQYLRD